MAKFWIEQESSGTSKGEFFLKTEGVEWSPGSIKSLLKSTFFREHKPELVPVLEKALEMIERGETGDVNISDADIVSPKHTDSKAFPKSVCDASPEMYELLQDIASPRRGTEAEMWNIEPRVVQIAARIIADIVPD